MSLVGGFCPAELDETDALKGAEPPHLRVRGQNPRTRGDETDALEGAPDPSDTGRLALTLQVQAMTYEERTPTRHQTRVALRPAKKACALLQMSLQY